MRNSATSLPVSILDASGSIASRLDAVAVEEPLQIRLGSTNLAVTMRTPGQDRELAAGFLFTEGIVTSPSQVTEIHLALNEAIVTVSEDVELQAGAAHRNFYMTSSCGVCGKASVEMIRARGCGLIPLGKPLDPRIVSSLSAKLRQRQTTFDLTGGLHAAGLFSREGELLSVYEDIGRHNAVDKVIGAEFLAGRLPLSNHILLVSGRTSFELVQKAVMAGIPVLAAVGAPSSLAVELARRFHLTLCGFVKEEQFNVYSCVERFS